MENVPIDSIIIMRRRRGIDRAKVDELAGSIAELGLLCPVTVTKDFRLIAGAHRLEACRKLGWQEIACTVADLDGLMSELAEIDENLIRNELHYTERGEHLLRRKEIYEELHPESKNGGNSRTKLFRSAPSYVEDTAKKLNSSPRTVEQEIQLARDLTPAAKDIARTADIPKTDALKLARLGPQMQTAVVEQLADGKAVTVADAIREVKRSEVAAKLEQIDALEAKASEGVFDVIVIDPPWPMQKIERDVAPNQVGLDYPVMSEDELAALDIPAAESCHLWLWTTQKYLPMAFRLLERWNFTYVCAFVWHKPGGFQPFGLPQYNCEFALYARRGTPSFIDTRAFPTCFTAPRGAHSEKPGEFYDLVRRVTPGRRLDMFNRRFIDGFCAWGKEASP